MDNNKIPGVKQYGGRVHHPNSGAPFVHLSYLPSEFRPLLSHLSSSPSEFKPLLVHLSQARSNRTNLFGQSSLCRRDLALTCLLGCAPFSYFEHTCSESGFFSCKMFTPAGLGFHRLCCRSSTFHFPLGWSARGGGEQGSLSVVKGHSMERAHFTKKIKVGESF